MDRGGPRLTRGHGVAEAAPSSVRSMAGDSVGNLGRLVVLAAILLAGCATGSATRSMTSSHADQAGMACTEATRVASGALLRLGFDPEMVAAPQPGVPGTVVGRRNTGWSAATPEAGEVYTATVTISCSNRGAEFDAVTDLPLASALAFKTDFASTIDTVASRRINRPRLAERPATGLVIGMEPLRGGDVTSEFGSDLSAAGITPVRVKIDNRTDRTYTFAAARVRLVTQEGERVKPLADDGQAQLTATLQATMREKRITDAPIAPNAVVSGFLYFPASAYRRATVVLIDQATEEEEGFSVEF